MARFRWRCLVLPLLLVSVLPSPASSAEEPRKEPARDSGKAKGEVKRAGREILEDVKAVGRDIRKSKAGTHVEEGAKEFGRDAAEVSRKGWSKTRTFTSSATDEVKRATLEFWDDVVRTKQEVVEKLRKENAELKAGKQQKETRRSEPAKEAE